MTTSNEATTMPLSVLFVCLGNICRSPMAEGVFRSLLPAAAPSNHFTLALDNIDSAGTGAFHVDSPPDPRTTDVLVSHKITDYNHSARKVQLKDFEQFDYIFAMDAENLEDFLYERNRALKAKQKQDGGGCAEAPRRATRKAAQAPTKGRNANHLENLSIGKASDGLAHVMLFGAFGGRRPTEEVGDPYYGGRNGFDIAYEQVDRFSKGFLNWLENASAEQAP